MLLNNRFIYMMNSNIITRVINNTTRTYLRIPHVFVTCESFFNTDATSIASANAKQNIARESLYCGSLVDIECRDVTVGAESPRGNQRNQINPYTKKSMSNNDWSMRALRETIKTSQCYGRLVQQVYRQSYFLDCSLLPYYSLPTNISSVQRNFLIRSIL